MILYIYSFLKTSEKLIVRIAAGALQSKLKIVERFEFPKYGLCELN